MQGNAADKTLRRAILATFSTGTCVYLFHSKGAVFAAVAKNAPPPLMMLLGMTSGILLGLSFLAILAALLRLEKPVNWTAYLRIGRPSFQQMFVYLLLSNGAFLANCLLLDEALWRPLQIFLEEIGLHGEQVGGAWAVPEAIDSSAAPFVLIGLLLICWIEAPEEMLFRGYIQNRLEHRFGRIAALAAATFLWDLMHLFALANFFERYYLGFITSGLIFAIYRNTTTPAIMHPLDNRAGYFILAIAALLGVNITSPFMYWLMTNLFIVFVILVVMLGGRLWKEKAG